MVHKLQNYKDMFTLYGPIGVILGIFFLFLCVNNVHRFVGPASSRYDVATSIGKIKIVIYFDTRGDVYFCNEEPSSRDCFFFSPSPSMIWSLVPSGDLNLSVTVHTHSNYYYCFGSDCWCSLVRGKSLCWSWVTNAVLHFELSFLLISIWKHLGT